MESEIMGEIKVVINCLFVAVFLPVVSVLCIGYIGSCVVGDEDLMTTAKKEVKKYCLDTGIQECQICIKEGSGKCDVYITLKGKEMEEFVKS